MLITHANLITWDTPNQVLEDHALLLQDGRIAALGPSAELEAQHPAEERLDARGQYGMPGLIVAHGHYYSALAVGLSIPGEAPITLPTVLTKMWWPFDRALGPEEVRLSALVGIIDAIKHGATTLFDHHSSPECADGALDIIAEAVEQGGVRSVLCFETTDRNGPQLARAGINENARFVRRCSQERVAGGRVRANFGIHAPMTVSEATLAACREAAPEGTGFHLHVAEHEYDQVRSLALAGTRSVDRLQRHGILGERTILAHAIHLDAREIALAAETRSWVSHQPRNNMNDGDGIMAVESYLRAGVRVCLGNDGLSNTMWKEAEAAAFLQRHQHRDVRRMPGDQLLQLAVYNNAALASAYYPEAPIGVLRPGAAADLILVDYQPATPLTADNLAGHLVFAFNESMITTTIVDGKILMRDRRLLTLDEQRIKARARELTPALWRRFASLVPTDPVLG